MKTHYLIAIAVGLVLVVSFTVRFQWGQLRSSVGEIEKTPVENRERTLFLKECMYSDSENKEAFDMKKVAEACECAYDYIGERGGDLSDDDLYFEAVLHCTDIKYE